MHEMENSTFTPPVHIVYLFYLKCMLVPAAAHTPANHAKQKLTWHGKFLVDCLHANFSSMKITSPTKINTKKQK